MAEISEIYNKKKFSSTFLNIIFLAFTIIIFLWLFFYNGSLEKNNNLVKNQIEEKVKSINSLKTNPLIKIAYLYEANKTTIMRLEKYSKIVDYIEHLKEIWDVYNLRIKWFSYNSWKLKANLYALDSSDRKTLAYEKLAKFISEYRNDSEALFDLWFIPRIDNNIGDKEKIALNLTLK